MAYQCQILHGTVLRAHTVYDLSKKECFKAHIAGIHTGESVKLHSVKAENLYFAERAYGKTPQMEYMLANKAEFVFRFSPSQVRLLKDVDCTEKIDFNSYLSQCNTLSSIDFLFSLGECFPIILIYLFIPITSVEINQTYSL